MHHETSLIATIAVGLAFAFVGGFIAVRLRLPPLVGYLLAGVAAGPFTPGFVADTKLAPQLAEIGVILLMFGVGMHFSLRDLLAVRAIALPGAIAQIVVATAMGVGVVSLWGWPFGSGLVFGLALSVASTVVLLRALEGRGRLDTHDGQIAVGWLIVEDLVMVLALVLLPALAGPLGGHPVGHEAGPLWTTLGVALAKVAVFIALMLVVGTRLFPWLLKRVENTGSRELFTLAVVALGMLFDPAILVRQPLQVLSVVAIIVVGKSVAALGIVPVLRYSMRTALTVSAALAQIGEFSFILAGLGLWLGLLPAEGPSLIVAGALLSITLNPLLFYAVDRINRG